MFCIFVRSLHDVLAISKKCVPGFILQYCREVTHNTFYVHAMFATTVAKVMETKTPSCKNAKKCKKKKFDQKVTLYV